MKNLIFIGVDQLRHDSWTGWGIGEPYGLIWGASRDLNGMASWRQQLVTYWRSAVALGGDGG